MTEPDSPNLFSHARSELAQDAVLAWMAAWADEQYRTLDPDLHALGRRFVAALLGVAQEKDEAQQNAGFTSVEVDTQQQFVDVLIRLDAHGAARERWIVLEDKTETNEHREQVSRYRERLVREKGIPSGRVHAVMVHTGDVHDLHAKKYGVLKRADLLDVLQPYTGSNAIVQDFRHHLKKWHEEVIAYEEMAFLEWGKRQWQGFFSALTSGPEPVVKDAWWGYVPNAQGGFWGMAWHVRALRDQPGKLYLQIEGTRDGAKLVAKVEETGTSDRRQLRHYAHDLLAEVARAEQRSLTRPDRFGHGRHMTIAVLEKEIRRNGESDVPVLQNGWLEHVRSTLRRAEHLIDLAALRD